MLIYFLETQLPVVNKQRNILNIVYEYVYNYYLFSINVQRKNSNIVVNLLDSSHKTYNYVWFQAERSELYSTSITIICIYLHRRHFPKMSHKIQIDKNRQHTKYIIIS